LRRARGRRPEQLHCNTVAATGQASPDAIKNGAVLYTNTRGSSTPPRSPTNDVNGLLASHNSTSTLGAAP
jgi:hypothetical protein